MAKKEETVAEVVKKPANGKTETASAPQSMLGPNDVTQEKVKMSEIQIDKWNKMVTQEAQLKAKLNEIYQNKNDFFELILDAKGWTPEKLKRVVGVNINEENEIELTLKK